GGNQQAEVARRGQGLQRYRIGKREPSAVAPVAQQQVQPLAVCSRPGRDLELLVGLEIDPASVGDLVPRLWRVYWRDRLAEPGEAQVFKLEWPCPRRECLGETMQDRSLFRH